MLLLDSNIVIYLHGGKLDHEAVGVIRSNQLATSNIIVAEVLSYSYTTKIDLNYFKEFFLRSKNFPFDEAVTKKVVELRTTTSIKLPDAIIAATALTNDLELWTHNTKDFKKIKGLKLFDPLTNKKV